MSRCKLKRLPRPEYLNGERGLIAAVVLQAVRDAHQGGLLGEEARDWLQGDDVRVMVKWLGVRGKIELCGCVG